MKQVPGVRLGRMDDDSPPASPGTGCGPCRDKQHGTNWKERLDGAAPAAACDDSEDPVPSGDAAPTQAVDAEDSACVEHSSADDVSEQSPAEQQSAHTPSSPSSGSRQLIDGRDGRVLAFESIQIAPGAMPPAQRVCRCSCARQPRTMLQRATPNPKPAW